MLINEAGLVRAIKRAYKHGGYVVANLGDAVAIYTENWYIQANRALFSRKALATIVEHMGMIPEKNVPTSILKDEDPQLVLKEVAADDMSHWRGGERGEEVTLVPVIMQGYQIFQPPGGGSCWGVPLYLLDMIERDAAEHNPNLRLYATDRQSQDHREQFAPERAAWGLYVWTSQSTVYF